MSYPRTRVKSESVGVQDIYLHWKDGSTSVTQYDTQSAAPWQSSVITDIAKKRRRRHGRARGERYDATPVDHSKVSVLEYNPPEWGSPSNADLMYFKTAIGEWKFSLNPASLLAQVTSSTESEISEFAEEAFTTLSAQMPEEISLPNFAFELRELDTLLPRLQTKLSRAEVASNGLLTWEFGLKPLLSDLETLAGLSNTVLSRLLFLKKTRGKRVRLGAYKEIPRGEPLEDITHTMGDSFFRASTGVLYRLRCIARVSELRVGGYLYHELEGLDSLGGLIRAYLAATGFGSPLKMVWNAIPYSFVVDWFTNLSSLLDNTRNLRPFEGVWDFHDFTWSVKDKVEWDVWLEPDGSPVPSLPKWGGRVLVSRYRRDHGLPARAFTLEFPPSQREALLLTALMR
jgi:hypothetical protein